MDVVVVICAWLMIGVLVLSSLYAIFRAFKELDEFGAWLIFCILLAIIYSPIVIICGRILGWW